MGSRRIAWSVLGVVFLDRDDCELVPQSEQLGSLSTRLFPATVERESAQTWGVGVLLLWSVDRRAGCTNGYQQDKLVLWRHLQRLTERHELRVATFHTDFICISAWVRPHRLH